MRKRIIYSLFAFAAILLMFSLADVRPVSGEDAACNTCVQVNGPPNAGGVYCGPTSGSFTLGPTGAIRICGLCAGTYTFCVSGGGTVSITVDGNSNYSITVNNGAECPCPD